MDRDAGATRYAEDHYRSPQSGDRQSPAGSGGGRAVFLPAYDPGRNDAGGIPGDHRTRIEAVARRGSGGRHQGGVTSFLLPAARSVAHVFKGHGLVDGGGSWFWAVELHQTQGRALRKLPSKNN